MRMTKYRRPAGAVATLFALALGALVAWPTPAHAVQKDLGYAASAELETASGSGTEGYVYPGEQYAYNISLDKVSIDTENGTYSSRELLRHLNIDATLGDIGYFQGSDITRFQYTDEFYDWSTYQWLENIEDVRWMQSNNPASFFRLSNDATTVHAYAVLEQPGNPYGLHVNTTMKISMEAPAYASGASGQQRAAASSTIELLAQPWSTSGSAAAARFNLPVTVTFVNPELSFVKQQLAEDGTRKPLPGAAFALYRCVAAADHEHVGAPGEDGSCWREVLTSVSDDDGTVTFGMLPLGSYALVETSTPEGFEEPDNYWTFTVADNAGTPDVSVPVAVGGGEAVAEFGLDSTGELALINASEPVEPTPEEPTPEDPTPDDPTPEEPQKKTPSKPTLPKAGDASALTMAAVAATGALGIISAMVSRRLASKKL